MKMQPAGKDAKRIVAEDGTIIGFALELANGRWAPFGKDGNKRLVEIGVSFPGPKEVFAFFKTSIAGTDGGAA
jgi:hypothetical protein